MSSSTNEEPLSVVIDGLNVMGYAENNWNMPSWLGLVNLLTIFKEISENMDRELLLITVLRQHEKLEISELPEFLYRIRTMSKLIILSEKSEREDDDYIAMAICKLHRGYFVSNDFKIQNHIGEEKSWADSRRITISFNHLTRGMKLNIPEGKFKQLYEDLMDNLTNMAPLSKESRKTNMGKQIHKQNLDNENTKDLLETAEEFPTFSLPKSEKISCLYCNSQFDSKKKVELHIAKTGHNQFRSASFAEIP